MIGHDFPYLDTRDLNLDWLLKNMKLIIKQWADYQTEMNTKFDNLNDAFDELKDWIDSYFENLNVQTEINNKLDAMKTSGELAEVMQPLISDETAAWLAAHITQPTTPAIDSSLTVQGAAADAKAAGDRIAAVMADLLTCVKGLGFSLTPERVAEGTPFEKYSDLNNIGTENCVNNIVLRYTGFTSDNAILHAPRTPFNGHVLCVSVSESSNFGMQIAIDDLGNMWFRKYYQTNDVWEQILVASKIDTIINNTNIVCGIGRSLTPNLVAEGAAFEKYGDLNNLGTTDCPNNIVIRYAGFTSSNTIQHAPYDGFNGMVASFSATNGSNFGLQIAIDESKSIWMRYFIGAAPSTHGWVNINALNPVKGIGVSLTPERVAVGARFEKYSDLNNLGTTDCPNNIILRYANFTSANAIQHAPYDGFNGMVASLSVSDASNFGMQIAIDESKSIWMRYFIGATPSTHGWVNLTGHDKYYISTAAELYNVLTTTDNAEIYLAPGTYDLYTGLYENLILSDVVDRHFISGNLKIYGDNATIQIHVPDSVAEAHKNSANMTSVLDIRCDAEINNVMFDCVNTRYCVHYESLAEVGAHYNKVVFNNCRFKYTRNVADLNAHCIGIGANLGQVFEFNRCKFENNIKGGIYIHGRDYNIGSLNISNCVFTGQSYGICLSQYTGNALPCNVDISNSKVGVILVQSQGGRTDLQWHVTIINSDYTLQNTSGYNYLYPPEEYDTITS